MRTWQSYPQSSMSFSVLLQDHANAIPGRLLGVGSVCGLGRDSVGIHSISLAARYRTAACSNTLKQGLEKIQAARAFDFAPRPRTQPDLGKELSSSLHVLWHCGCLQYGMSSGRDGKLDEASQDKKQKVATGLRRNKLHTLDFAGPISSRASKILGPISRYRDADILPHMRLASRARLKDFTLRVMNRGVVLDVRMNPVRSAFFVRCVHFLGQATVLPRRNTLSMT